MAGALEVNGVNGMASAFEATEVSGMDIYLDRDSPEDDHIENGVNLFAPNNDVDSEMPNTSSKTCPTSDESDIMMEIIREQVEEGQGETIYELGTGGLQL